MTVTINGTTGETTPATIFTGATSGSITVQATAVAGTNTITLPAATGNIAVSSNSYTGGMTPNTLLYRLNADLVGTQALTAQSTFGVGVTLSANTVYAFDAEFALSKSAGTTSHTIGIGFGGAATLNNIGYRLNWTISGTIGTVIGSNTSTASSYYISSGSNQTITTANTNATLGAIITVRGTVSINGAGTFIPQYTLSAAPGGAYSTVAGSYFMIYPIGASGANVSIGPWA